MPGRDLRERGAQTTLDDEVWLSALRQRRRQSPDDFRRTPKQGQWRATVPAASPTARTAMSEITDVSNPLAMQTQEASIRVAAAIHELRRLAVGR